MTSFRTNHLFTGIVISLMATFVGCTIQGTVGRDPSQWMTVSDGKTPIRSNVLQVTFEHGYDEDWTDQDDRVVQNALSRNRDRAPTSWHNSTRGDFTIVPVDTQTANGHTCRNYYIDYVFVGTFVSPMRMRGAACLNDGLWSADPNSIAFGGDPRQHPQIDRVPDL